MNNNRTKSLGGSDIAPLLNKSPWMSPYQLYLSKTNSIYANQSTNLAMEIGNELESFVLKKYQEKTGNKLITDKEKLFKVHKDYPFLSSNLDAITVDGKTIVEVKTSSSLDGWGEEYTNEIPEAYKLQIAHYANIWDVDKVDIVLLTLGKGKGIYYYTYLRNKLYEASIQKLAVIWWNKYILGNETPDCTASDISSYEKDKVEKDSVMQMNAHINLEVTTRIGAIKSASATIKHLEEKIADNKKVLANILKSKEVLQDSNGKVIITYKLINKEGGVDSKKLKEDYPEIYNKYLKENVCYRQLTIK